MSSATACFIVLFSLFLESEGFWCPPGGPPPVPVTPLAPPVPPAPAAKRCVGTLLGQVEGAVSSVVHYVQGVTCQGIQGLQHLFMPYRQPYRR